MNEISQYATDHNNALQCVYKFITSSGVKIVFLQIQMNVPFFANVMLRMDLGVTQMKSALMANVTANLMANWCCHRSRIKP